MAPTPPPRFGRPRETGPLPLTPPPPPHRPGAPGKPGPPPLPAPHPPTFGALRETPGRSALRLRAERPAHLVGGVGHRPQPHPDRVEHGVRDGRRHHGGDRKSTRLNSSHSQT